MIADVRAHLADTLASIGVPVHPYPPGTMTPPSVAILPADPYWEGLALQGAHRITLRAYIVASNPRALDDLIDVIISTLLTAGLPPEPVLPPDSDADAGTLSASVVVPIMWTF